MENIFRKQSAEEILKKAEKSSFKKRRDLLAKNIESIKKFLYAEDAIPTRNQLKINLQEKLNEIAGKVNSGEKLYGVGLTNSYKATFSEIQRAGKEILEKLKEKSIKASELEKSYYYSHSITGKENWSEEKIKNLPFDWIVGAVINYHKNRSAEKDANTERELSAQEVKKCLEIIKQRNK